MVVDTVTNQQRAPNDLTGQRVGGSYKIICLLGEGGMGQVWLARALGLDNREAAVKVLNNDALSNPEYLMRFKAEVRIVGALRTNGVVEVWDAGELPDGRHYMIMEFCDGGSLASLLQKKGRLSIEDTFVFTVGPAQALRAAHAAKHIHRDVKPDNILLLHDEDRLKAKLSDFGIAKLNSDLFNDEFIRTGTMKVMGTPGYMAPEQVNPKGGIDHRADIFSFGCVIYRCLTGELPYPARNALEYCQAVWPGQAKPMRPVNPRQHRSEIPLELDALVMACLEIDRNKRPTSIDVVVNRFAQAFPRGQALLRFSAPKFLDRATAPTANTISESIGVAVTQELSQTRARHFRRSSVAAFLGGALLSGIATTLVVSRLGAAPRPECNPIAAAQPPARTATPALAAPNAAVKQAASAPPTPATVSPEPDTKSQVTTQVAANSASVAANSASVHAVQVDPPSLDARPPSEAGSDTRVKPQDAAKPQAPKKLPPAPKTPDARPQATTKAQDGVIAVSVKQTWAQVWIDGVYQESTPVRATVPTGTHKVLLVSGGHRETVTVTVQAGGVSVVTRDW